MPTLLALAPFGVLAAATCATAFVTGGLEGSSVMAVK